MTDKQPEALIWAGQLELLLPFMRPAAFTASTKAIAELRRLHEENEALKRCLFQMQEAAKGQGLTAAKATAETALQRLNKAAENNGEEL